MSASPQPPPGPNVVLIGFMGSGKTTAGRRMAAQLGLRFVDTDELVAQAAGRTIPGIFADEGEAGFRARETAVLDSLAGEHGLVISTGGGIVTVPGNLPRLRALGYVIWLNPPEDAIFERISRSRDRPLLRTPDPRRTVHDLLEARRPLYAAAADLEAEMAGLSADECAWGLAESVRVHFARQRGGDSPVDPP